MASRPPARCSPRSWAASPPAPARPAASASESTPRAARCASTPRSNRRSRPRAAAAAGCCSPCGRCWRRSTPTAPAARRSRSCGWLSLRPAVACRRPHGRDLPDRVALDRAGASTAPRRRRRLYAANTLGAAAGAIAGRLRADSRARPAGATLVGVALNVVAAGRSAGWRAPPAASTGTDLQPAVPAPRRQVGKRRASRRATVRRTSRGWRPRRAGRQRLRVADPAGGLDAAARADSRPDHLRVQHRRRDLHRRHRGRRGDRIAPGRADEEAGGRPRRLPCCVGRGAGAGRGVAVDWALLAVAEIVSRPSISSATCSRREVCWCRRCCCR